MGLSEEERVLQPSIWGQLLPWVEPSAEHSLPVEASAGLERDRPSEVEQTWQAGALEELQQPELLHSERSGSASLASGAGVPRLRRVEHQLAGLVSAERGPGQAASVEASLLCAWVVAVPPRVLVLAALLPGLVAAQVPGLG